MSQPPRPAQRGGSNFPEGSLISKTNFSPCQCRYAENFPYWRIRINPVPFLSRGTGAKSGEKHSPKGEQSWRSVFAMNKIILKREISTYMKRALENGRSRPSSDLLLRNKKKRFTALMTRHFMYHWLCSPHQWFTPLSLGEKLTGSDARFFLLRGLSHQELRFLWKIHLLRFRIENPYRISRLHRARSAAICFARTWSVPSRAS